MTQQTDAGAGVARSLRPFSPVLDAYERLCGMYERAGGVDPGGLKDHPLWGEYKRAIQDERDHPGGWVPVGERLPDTGVWVLVVCLGVVAIAYYAGKEHGWYAGSDDCLPFEWVSYWQHLPAPPDTTD